MFNHSLFHPKIDRFGQKKVPVRVLDSIGGWEDSDWNDSAAEIFALTWENLFV